MQAVLNKHRITPWMLFCLLTAGLAFTARPATGAEVKPDAGVGKEFLDTDLDFLEEEKDEAPAAEIADPFYPVNLAMFHFNDRLYFWLLKPAAETYRALLPVEVRSGVQNFFRNLTTPVRLVSCLLQAKGKEAGTELIRFLYNSTAGFLGFRDAAKKDLNIERAQEDLGQTLGSYGIGNGFYLVLPFLGPSTLRDSLGTVGDFFLDPVTYVQPAEASLGIRTGDTINSTSLHLGDYESFKESALLPYEAFRDAYLQHRRKMIEN